MMPQTIDDGRRAGVSSVADLDGFAARFAALPERLNGDAGLLRRGRYLNATSSSTSAARRCCCA